MPKIYIRNIVITLIFLVTLTSAITFSSGPGGGYSNAPGENNCTMSGCHTGSLITSGNSNLNNILLKPHFTNGGYIPDSTYQIELTFKQSGISRFGFEITCLNSSTNLMEGTFTAGNSRVQKATATISGKSRNYLEHTYAGSSGVATDSSRWVITWKAPSADDGKIKFYVVINAANNNGQETGDIIYAKTFEYSCGANFPLADAKSNDTITCTNYKAAFTGTGSNSPTSYSWKFTGATPATSTQQNPTVTFTAPGTQYAILTVNNSGGSSKPDTVKVKVNQSPTAIILNGTTATICKGDSLLLSAKTGNYSYKWTPSGKTATTVWAKDTGIYTLTTKSTLNGCTATSTNFKLNHNIKPTTSITRISNKDSFCGTYSDLLTASGTNIDSVLWYANGKIIGRTKSLSYNIKVSQDAVIYAAGKSVNGCLSVPSNSFKVVVVKKIAPTNFTSSKTTSDINLNWTKPAGVDSIRYAINGGVFGQPTTDSTLRLTGMTPNTTYNITIRTYQKNFCKYGDSTISIKTNACSNLSYYISLDVPRVCRGGGLNCKVTDLYKAKYSLSFNKGPFAKDTLFTFKPGKTDSITIHFIDSLNLGCPPIIEKVAYTVDTLPKETSYGPIILSCDSQFLYKIKPLYQNYEFYKNNVKVSGGASNSYLYSKLISGDVLSSKAAIYSCSKTYTSTFNINTTYSSAYSYSHVGKNYIFKANDSLSAIYNWHINNVPAGTTPVLAMDMTPYKGTNVIVSLASSDLTGCSDSSKQTITIPDFSSIQSIQANHIRIYPNPFNETLTIETDLDDFELELCDITGKIIPVDVQQNSINTGNLSSGLYFIRLKKDGKIVYQNKFVKI